MKTTRGLYIHIPFCLSKCTYCDFYSVSKDTEIMEKYVDALVDEIKIVGNKFSDKTIDTIYIGGGTPSVLPLYLLEKIVHAIIANFKLDLIEFTIEANPATDLAFEEYKNLGINRLSLGVQTLNDDLLRIIGRKHDSKTALTTIDTAKKYFDNLSCDLMIGLPNQTMEDVLNSANIISNLVPHVSTYMLKLSDNVLMSRQILEGKLSLLDDDVFADYYDIAYSVYKSNGLKRYEISNFARPGYESQHNLKYWRREEYIGLGAAAHGFISERRYFNPSNLNEYIEGVNFGNDKVALENITSKTALFEKIMLALRLEEGINIDEINSEFNIDFIKLYAKQLSFLKPLLNISNNNISIKEEKILLESAISREFLD